MTGEMVKARNAELGNDYWERKSSSWGSIIGDEGVLIRPNYPDIFDLSDKLASLGVENEVRPFDVYRGPYIEIGNYNSFLSNYILQIWYSDDLQQLSKWRIECPLEQISACDDEEAIELITTLLPLLRIRQS
jgi:hypothetical protein